MATVIQIVNSALIKLGSKQITALTDSSDAALTMNALYEPIRDDLLAAHVWNFATKRAKLARLTETPAYGWDYAYQLPADYLRVVEVHDNDAGAGGAAYKIETLDTVGPVVMANVSDVWCRYIARITDPNVFSSNFREALSWALAANAAGRLLNSNTAMEQTTAMARRALMRARSVDAIENSPPELPAGSWASARDW